MQTNLDQKELDDFEKKILELSHQADKENRVFFMMTGKRPEEKDGKFHSVNAMIGTKDLIEEMFFQLVSRDLRILEPFIHGMGRYFSKNKVKCHDLIRNIQALYTAVLGETNQYTLLSINNLKNEPENIINFYEKEEKKELINLLTNAMKEDSVFAEIIESAFLYHNHQTNIND